MNEPPPIEAASPSFRQRLVRWALWLVIAALLLFCVAPGFLIFQVLEPAAVLALGWLKFIYRTIPQASWNWDLMGMTLLASAGILILGQTLCAWGTKHLALARGQNWKWPWKWTCSGLFAVVLLFLVGMSVGGATHQIGWMVSSPDPWFEEKGRGRDWIRMRSLESLFKMALRDAQGDLDRARHELWQPNNYLGGSVSTMQSYHLLVVQTEDGKVAGTIIFPRNAAKLATQGGIKDFDEKSDRFTAEELPALLEKYRDRLIAF